MASAAQLCGAAGFQHFHGQMWTCCASCALCGRSGGYRFYAGLGKEEAKWAKQRFRTAEVRTAARLLRCLASGMVSYSAGDSLALLRHDIALAHCTGRQGFSDGTAACCAFADQDIGGTFSLSDIRNPAAMLQGRCWLSLTPPSALDRVSRELEIRVAQRHRTL